MKNTVIYHSADFDGIFCREIAKKFLPPDTEFIGWNFGNDTISFPKEGTVYVLDLSPDVFTRETALIDNTRLIWIDHHKTSLAKWSAMIPGYRIDGVAACRLTWQWFVSKPGPTAPGTFLPAKEEYISRLVSEPLAVRLAGEYDIWDKRDPNAETFQYALRASPLTPVGWAALFDGDRAFVNQLLVDGRTCQRYAQEVDASTCRNRTWIMVWEGLKFLCVNSARFNSLFFAAKDVPETGHDALMGFCYDGKGWTVSLYHAKHNTGLDLSAIAKKYGGGGHKGACGFICNTLPFNLTNEK